MCYNYLQSSHIEKYKEVQQHSELTANFFYDRIFLFSLLLIHPHPINTSFNTCSEAIKQRLFSY